MINFFNIKFALLIAVTLITCSHVQTDIHKILLLIWVQRVYKYIYIYVFTLLSSRSYIYIYIYLFMYIYIYIYIYIFIYNTYIYIYITYIFDCQSIFLLLTNDLQMKGTRVY